MKWTVGAKIGSGFGMALLILVGIGAVSYRSTNKLTETANWVTHTHRVLEGLNGILQSIVDAETGQRGFIITSEEQYLEPYRSGVARVMDHVREVKSLTRDNPRQLERANALEAQIRERLAILNGGIEVHKSKGLEESRPWVLSGKGKKEMEETRSAVAEMREQGREDSGAEDMLVRVGGVAMVPAARRAVPSAPADEKRRGGRCSASASMSERSWRRVSGGSIHR